MPVTTIQLVNEILTEFREISAQPISTTATECLEFLNWAKEDLCTNAMPFRSAATRTVFANNSIVELPEDCMKLDQVYEGQSRMDVRNYEDMDDTDPKWRMSESSGHADRYIPLSWNKGEISPRLTVAATLDYMGYYAMPYNFDFVNDDPGDLIPESSCDDMKKYVLALLHAKTRNIDLAIEYISEYSSGRNKTAKDAHNNQSEAKVMTMKLPSRSTYGRTRRDR
jgi:hypothetical protein